MYLWNICNLYKTMPVFEIVMPQVTVPRFWGLRLRLRCKRPTGTFTRFYLMRWFHKGKAVLFAFPSKSCRFSHPFSPRAESTAQGVSPPAGGDQGRCPWTLPAFLKNCWIKKLHCRLRRGDILRQYRAKIVRQMRRQFFRQMKQKAE